MTTKTKPKIDAVTSNNLSNTIFFDGRLSNSSSTSTLYFLKLIS